MKNRHSKRGVVAELPKAKKALGQNWLTDERCLDAIVSSLHLSARSVLEIGPGTGLLSAKILQQLPHELVSVELDTDMVTLLERSLQNGDIRIPSGTQWSVYHGDALTYIPRWSEYVIVANIPYYITSPLLFRYLVEIETPPQEMVILMQKEVGEKILQKHGSSRLAITIAFRCESIQKVLDVPSHAFVPAPKVDSVALKFTLKKDFDRDLYARLDAFLVTGFIHPRKLLIANLIGGGIARAQLERIFWELGFSLTVRPHELSLDEWLLLIWKLFS